MFFVNFFFKENTDRQKPSLRASGFEPIYLVKDVYWSKNYQKSLPVMVSN